MSQESLVCNIKAPVLLQVGDMKTELARPGVAVIDVTFPQVKHIDLHVIQFKNYYTAFLTVRIQQRRPAEVGEGPLKWRTCLRNYRLMPNPHTEECSHDYVSLYRHQMIGDVNHVTSVRFILRQPSPAWLQFNIEEIQINPCGQSSPQKVLPIWLSTPSTQEQTSSLHHELPDPDKVSKEVQQMWVLTEMIRANQTSSRIGRFDGWSGYMRQVLEVIWRFIQLGILFSVSEKCGIFVKVQINSLFSDNAIQYLQCLQESVSPPRAETEELHSLHKPCSVSSTIHVFYVAQYKIS